MITTLLIVAVLAADPPPKNDTMKALLKDVATDKPSDGPDVSKMAFNQDNIKQVVMAFQPKIQGCYEDHIANKKKAPQGTLKTSWVITPEGLVKSAKIEKKGTTLKDAALYDCVVAVLSTMEFPRPPDSKDHPIEFPFNLKAVQ